MDVESDLVEIKISIGVNMREKKAEGFKPQG
jgi:hypothetical protein